MPAVALPRPDGPDVFGVGAGAARADDRRDARVFDIRTPRFTEFDWKRHTNENGQDKQAERPDAGGHAQFDPGGRVLDDFPEGRGNEARDHESDPFLDPDADEQHRTRWHE